MIITAVIDSRDPKLLNDFIKRGIKAKFVTNGILIELPETKTGSKIYTMPAECNVEDLRIKIAEEGGCTDNGGFSIIVCGRTGKRLHPYGITTRKGTENGKHAYFSVRKSIATIKGHYGDSYVEIRTHDIVVNKKGEVRIRTRLKYKINLEESPGKLLQQYVEAAKAAIIKANCYNCNHVHYATEGCYNS